MHRLFGVTAAIAGASAFAQEVDAGVVSPLVDEVPMVKVVFQSVASGNWWAAAAALLVLVVLLVRKYGKVLHDKLPDEHPLDKVLWFILDTKPGGWLLNLSTTIAGGLGTALLAAEPISWSLIKPILIVSVTGSSLWELVKDVWEFVEKRKNAQA